MKRRFFQFKTAFIYQIVLWIFPVVLTGFLAVFDPPQTKENWEMLLFLFGFSAIVLNVPVMWFSLQRVVFTEDAVLVKLGPLTLQRLSKSDIVMADHFSRQSGNNTVHFYFFSTARLSAEEVNRYWNKLRIRNNKIIFCECRQKGLTAAIAAQFPTLFDPEHVLYFEE